jgi:hypothetical protein
MSVPIPIGGAWRLRTHIRSGETASGGTRREDGRIAIRPGRYRQTGSRSLRRSSRGALLSGEHAEVVRERVAWMVAELMEAKVAAEIGAELGELELRIPGCGRAATSRAFLSRRRAEQALIAVVQKAYLNGVSTRRVDPGDLPSHQPDRGPDAAGRGRRAPKQVALASWEKPAPASVCRPAVGSSRAMTRSRSWCGRAWRPSSASTPQPPSSHTTSPTPSSWSTICRQRRRSPRQSTAVPAWRQPTCLPQPGQRCRPVTTAHHCLSRLAQRFASPPL